VNGRQGLVGAEEEKKKKGGRYFTLLAGDPPELGKKKDEGAKHKVFLERMEKISQRCGHSPREKGKKRAFLTTIREGKKKKKTISVEPYDWLSIGRKEGKDGERAAHHLLSSLRGGGKEGDGAVTAGAGEEGRGKGRQLEKEGRKRKRRRKCSGSIPT